MIYKAYPRSRIKIRSIANELKKKFGLEKEFNIPIVVLLERLCEFCGFTLEILPVEKMSLKYGEAFPEEKIIHIREDIYNDACNDDGFSRSTIAHELFHLLFHGKTKLSFYRTDIKKNKMKVYEDPEWQANCFAGEFLVNKELVQGMEVNEVVDKCKVTTAMAEYQLRKYREEGKNE